MKYNNKKCTYIKEYLNNFDMYGNINSIIRTVLINKLQNASIVSPERNVTFIYTRKTIVKLILSIFSQTTYWELSIIQFKFLKDKFPKFNNIKIKEYINNFDIYESSNSIGY